ncbi:MarR family winged helix-turn-helix transcriptional regulator [Nitrospira lenta]|uniref:MarR family transcriptional regulator n=1 Tax=Nitrospira lenta TaxID=1436998 RepID=A0A330L362_9BACT|nr:MarR family winged helix-turn-helix transcriptional regulator [Nitrospira lenta]SPP64208.1 MarR family transcriptional regulator [Nitrospira lenta]
MGKRLPMHGEKTIVEHITVGLGKVSAALRSQAWEGGIERRLTPTQGQILLFLAARSGTAVRLNDIAGELCLTAATVSDAVMTLVDKKLIKKARSAEDQRALALTLTAAGLLEAKQTSGWTEVVQAGVSSLTPDEQAVFLRGLTKVMHSLQQQGVISIARMCAGCAYFQPYVHADSARPHHCGFVDAPLGEGQLRLDCPDFVPGVERDQERRWQTFVRGGQGQ